MLITSLYFLFKILRRNFLINIIVTKDVKFSIKSLLNLNILRKILCAYNFFIVFLFLWEECRFVYNAPITILSYEHLWKTVPNVCHLHKTSSKFNYNKNFLKPKLLGRPAYCYQLLKDFRSTPTYLSQFRNERYKQTL